MKTHSARRRSAVLLFSALLAASFAPNAALADPAPPSAAVQGDTATTIDLNRSDAVNLRLQTKDVTDAVDAAAHAERGPAIARAKRGAEDGRAITATLRAGARILSDGDRQEVEQEIDKAEQARQRLNGAISLAIESTESRWSDLREELSERYEQYATALEEAREGAVSGGVTFESQTSLVAPAPDIVSPAILVAP